MAHGAAGIAALAQSHIGLENMHTGASQLARAIFNTHRGEPTGAQNRGYSFGSFTLAFAHRLPGRHHECGPSCPRWRQSLRSRPNAARTGRGHFRSRCASSCRLAVAFDDASLCLFAGRMPACQLQPDCWSFTAVMTACTKATCGTAAGLVRTKRVSTAFPRQLCFFADGAIPRLGGNLRLVHNL